MKEQHRGRLKALGAAATTKTMIGLPKGIMYKCSTNITSYSFVLTAFHF